jgi:hypothetical protein
LSGCAQHNQKEIVTLQKTKIEYVKVPEELLDKEPMPTLPLKVDMQSDIAKYISDLWNSAYSCKEDMKRIEEFNNKE